MSTALVGAEDEALENIRDDSARPLEICVGSNKQILKLTCSNMYSATYHLHLDVKKQRKYALNNLFYFNNVLNIPDVLLFGPAELRPYWGL